MQGRDSSGPRAATESLIRYAHGDPTAADELLPLVYDELRELAGKLLARERPDHTLQPTALVHDAYIRLIDHQGAWQGRTHFFALAATTLRRVLVDHARGCRRLKRGGPDARRVTIVDPMAPDLTDPDIVLTLNELIEELGETRERLAQIVDMRFFAGMTVEETAQALQVSKDTVKLDWRFARAWLNQRLGPIE